MLRYAPLLLFGLMATPEPIETRFEQVHPVPRNKALIEPSPGRARAVILIHGLHFHPLNKAQTERAEFHVWQRSGSALVSALGADADVFSFAYSQNATLEKISETPRLFQAVSKLRFMGYHEIVLVGHSAGGLLARHFIEDHPQAPVTKIFQVCAPNLGSSWAKAEINLRKPQETFLYSLTKAERRACCAKRASQRIPARVQFVCIVGGNTLGDGLVSSISQWPPDLQAQGIPAIQVATTHFTVMHSRKTADKIAELVRKNYPRWSQDEVRLQKKRILGVE
jgi:pimeloyl-ACP methyl ester carboxylesterase